MIWSMNMASKFEVKCRTETKKVEDFVQELREKFGERLLPAASGYGAIDILQPGVNKATAIQFLEARWGRGWWASDGIWR